MKKILLASAIALSFGIGVAVAAPVHDWHDIDGVHTKIQKAIAQLAEARAKNHYDMEGHGAKAEELLKQAEVELRESVEAIKHER